MLARTGRSTISPGAQRISKAHLAMTILGKRMDSGWAIVLLAYWRTHMVRSLQVAAILNNGQSWIRTLGGAGVPDRLAFILSMEFAGTQTFLEAEQDCNGLSDGGIYS